MIASDQRWPAQTPAGLDFDDIDRAPTIRRIQRSREKSPCTGRRTGEEIFVIDGHTHFWDGSPANQKNIHGKQFIECFYAYHSNLSPPSEKWTKEKFEKYDAKTMYDDLFVHGYDDMAILQPTYLTDFYKNGFNTTERNSAMKKSHPDRFILNGAFDPRDGTKGIEDAARAIARSTSSRASSSTPPNGRAS